MKRYSILYIVITLFYSSCVNAADPLPSWNEGRIKQNIIHFVDAVTNKNSKEYVPPKDRIATIDNDGTLWVEQPQYTQMVFMIDRYKELGEKKPPSSKDPVKRLEEIYAVTSTQISVEDYIQVAQHWLTIAKHPRYKRLYTELIYQPMLEVMDYLRENQFQVYIVSGSGQEFIRAYAENTYGVVPSYVIGAMSYTEYGYKNNIPTLTKIPKLLLQTVNDGKPEAINLFIGKKPLIAFGNSDGDKEMLEWTQSGTGQRLMLLVHHDDEKREYAYDTQSKIGTFSSALMKQAENNHWEIISMKNDWKVIFPFELK